MLITVNPLVNTRGRNNTEVIRCCFVRILHSTRNTIVSFRGDAVTLLHQRYFYIGLGYYSLKGRVVLAPPPPAWMDGGVRTTLLRCEFFFFNSCWKFYHFCHSVSHKMCQRTTTRFFSLLVIFPPYLVFSVMICIPTTNDCTVQCTLLSNPYNNIHVHI